MVSLYGLLGLGFMVNLSFMKLHPMGLNWVAVKELI